jgi:hypothetical protein
MAERTNDNNAYRGAANYIDACSAEFARQAEAAQGLPNPFQPPPPQNENEREALKLWLAELERQIPAPAHDLEQPAPPAMANQNQRAPDQIIQRLNDGFPSFRPGAPQSGRYDDLKEKGSAAEADQNPRAAPEPMPANPTFGPETIAATSPAEVERLVEAMRATAAPEKPSAQPAQAPEPSADPAQHPNHRQAPQTARRARRSSR